MMPGMIPEHVLGGVLCPLRVVMLAEMCVL